MTSEFRSNDKGDFRLRASFVAALVLIAFGLLLLRFAYLQVWRHSDFHTMSEENRVALLPLQAPRGEIFDRHGNIIARNGSVFTLEIEPHKVPNLEETLEFLGTLISLEELDLRRFRRLKGELRKFDSIPLRPTLNDAEVARLVVHLHRLPGVAVNVRSMRYYPYGNSSSHLLGHIGRISKKDRERIEQSDQASSYFGTSHIGKLGLEQAYEADLRGRTGFDRMEITAGGRMVRSLAQRLPVPGKNLRLSIDGELQRLIEEAYGKRRGALVAMVPATGEVLAFVSMPNFNPALFIDGIDSATWDALNNSPDKPLLNRPLRGTYPPGSTYKPFMALAALESGTRTPDDTIYDPGYFMFGNHRFRDSNPNGNGTVDIRKSIVVSSDTYYYIVARDMGVDRIHQYIEPWGFGQKTGIDLIGEVNGILPSSKWKQERFKQPWHPGENMSIGIGQGYNSFSVLQMAVATAGLANRGVLMKPRLVQSIEDPNTGEVIKTEPEVLRKAEVSDKHLDLVIDAMVEVNKSGTGARVFAGAPYAVAGKTGTAQVISIGQNEKYSASRIAERHRDHSLYIAFAPADKPQVAVALIVENGGFGAAAAAPIARLVFDHLLVQKGDARAN
ncbi:MAG: penicillin-binding protein 2 [Burkholderiaceae bacterium]|nr:penicillin-binding protein 2 [Burkholderiaceae bacterium]